MYSHVHVNALDCFNDWRRSTISPSPPLRHHLSTDLGDVLVEVVHLCAEHGAEATQRVLVPRVVLEADLRLHLAVVDANRAELLVRLRGVERLARRSACAHKHKAKRRLMAA